MTIREALSEGTAVLTAANIESPGLDASLLLAEVLNISRSSLYAAGSDLLTEMSYSAFDRLIKRRLAGECVAYILGKKEFFGLEFLVNPSVLVPRPETELLVEVAMGELKDRGSGIGDQGIKNKRRRLQILDLCTGSGVVAITLRHQIPELEVWATDISGEVLEVAKTNAIRLLSPKAITFCQGNLFDALLHSPLNTPYSLIISNPPYIPSDEIPNLSPEVRSEPLQALDGGSDGLDIIRIIISQAPEFLCLGGILLLEADPSQMGTITDLLQQGGFIKIHVYNDLSGNERVISAKKM
jgi:release factor glutamine methyltransferase